VVEGPRRAVVFALAWAEASWPVDGRISCLQQRLVWLAGLAVLAASITTAHAVGDGAKGAKIFAANCARCHGQQGKGDGPDLVKLQSAVSPDDWTDKQSNQELTDSFIIAMITKGGKANSKSRIMPVFGDKLNPQQVQDLLAFIRSLAK
jgi:mono/diheme cytochrome c family protein